MAYKNQQPAVSKPLIIGLVVAAIIGVIFFATRMGGGPDEDNVPGAVDVPPSVRDMGPATPLPGEPEPIGVGR